MTVLTARAAPPAPSSPGPRSRQRHRRAPRLSVYRSNSGVFAQLIDDADWPHAWPRSTGSSPGYASSPPASKPSEPESCIAERAKAAGIETCVFDRGGYQYHGRVKHWPKGLARGGWSSSSATVGRLP